MSLASVVAFSISSLLPEERHLSFVVPPRGPKDWLPIAIATWFYRGAERCERSVRCTVYSIGSTVATVW
jgi:hypothetical protein